MRLEQLRQRIDEINENIISLFAERLEVALEIAKIKREENLPVFDPIREGKQKELLKKTAEKHNISPAIIDEIFVVLVEYSKRMQLGGGE